ncbi:MAG: SDR family oxidoreductase [Chloroflexi bacterium]|nr:SDR family oxidoreductase [Chloroflexota bacterium]
MGQLDGKIALITGAASGIGRATAALFAAEGAQVALGDWHEDQLEAITRQIRDRGGQVAARRTDVSKRADAQALVTAAIEAFGGLDVVVNNAGIGLYNTTLEQTAEDDWDRVMAVNLKGVYLVSQAAIPHIRARGGGSIINIASVHAMATQERIAAYAASKGGVLALTRAMAMDLATDAIRVNAVLPGAVDTPLFRSALAEEGKSAEELGFRFDPHAIGRVGQPEELARAILFLAGDASSFMTGSPMIVDGGLLARL